MAASTRSLKDRSACCRSRKSRRSRHCWGTGTRATVSKGQLHTGRAGESRGVRAAGSLGWRERRRIPRKGGRVGRVGWGRGWGGEEMAQLVLQHNLREPQHVRWQAQHADVPEVLSIPLQPTVRPALEADGKVSSGFCCCPSSLAPCNFPERDRTGSRAVTKGVWGGGWRVRTQVVRYGCVGCSLHS